jgi:hypothetical protein
LQLPGTFFLLPAGILFQHLKKKKSLRAFANTQQGPVFSLLRSHQQKLPEADFAVEAFDPADVVGVIRKILRDEP